MRLQGLKESFNMVELKFCNKKIRVKKAKLPSSTLGLSDMDKGLIIISNKLPQEQVPAVVGHELVHFILNTSGIDGFLTKKQEEALCDTIGKAIGELVTSNTHSNLLKAFL